MSEKTKREKTGAKSDAEKTSVEKHETGGEGEWRRDQREKSYYYDDAYGYEIYKPDDEDDDDDDEEKNG